MDYTDVLKRAWRVTWRYKTLWILGLFAGAGSGFGGGGSGSGARTGAGNTGTATQPDWAQVQAFFQHYGVLLVLAFLALVLIGLIFMVLSVAARGGLIHEVNEAEEGRPVRAGEGWGVGFSKWWRLFGVGFLAGLPMLIIGLIILAIVGAGVLAAIRVGSSANVGATLVGTFIGSACLVIALAIPAAILGLILGISAELGLRYVVLEDRRTVEALRQGWRDVWSKRGAFLMYLVQLGVGLAYGIIVGIVAVILIVPGVLIAVAGAWPVGILMAVGAILLLIVPSAAYSTFYHAAWTIFFRKMTGMEPKLATATGHPVAGGGMVPPPPAYAPVPPAPPISAPQMFDHAPMPAPEASATAIPEPPAMSQPPAMPEPPAPSGDEPPPGS